MSSRPKQRPRSGSRDSRKSRVSKSRGSTKSSRKSKPRPKRNTDVAPNREIKKLPIINKGPVIHTPRTGNISSHSGIVVKQSHASENMSLTDLQFMARAKGIPFGGLTKGKLVKKINAY